MKKKVEVDLESKRYRRKYVQKFGGVQNFALMYNKSWSFTTTSIYFVLKPQKKNSIFFKPRILHAYF